MKIIYDCTSLTKWSGNATGIQRVVEEIAKELSETQIITSIFDTNNNCYEYSVHEKKIKNKILINTQDQIFSCSHDWDYPEHFNRLLEHASRGVRFSVCFYDIIPLLFPFTYKPEFVERFELWLKKVFENCESCLAISQKTRSDILCYADKEKIKAPKISLLRLGDHLPSKKEKNHLSAQKNNFKKEFVLSVGTLEYRKNHIVLLNAYRILIEEKKFIPPHLYIVGRGGYLDSDIKTQVLGDNRIKEFITICEEVGDEELSQMYGAAMFTLYPSLYEGWGLPVAESLFHGKPCIATNRSAISDSLDSFITIANPYNADEWANHIYQLSKSPDILKEKSEFISKNFKSIRWSETAKELVDFLVQNN